MGSSEVKKYVKKIQVVYTVVFFKNRILPPQARGTNVSQTVQGRRQFIRDRKGDEEVGAEETRSSEQKASS